MFFKKEVLSIITVIANLAAIKLTWINKLTLSKRRLKPYFCTLLFLLSLNPALSSANSGENSEELASIVAQINDIQKNPEDYDLTPPGRIQFLSLAAQNSSEENFEAPSNIIGGNNADRREYREYVLVIGTDGLGNITFLCGGTLISSSTVLTAAHCSTNTASSYFTIPSFYTLTDPITVAGLFQVGRVAIHPQYNPASINNDIAVMTLVQSSSIPPASVHAGQSALDGADGTVIGTGLVASSPSSFGVDVLQEVAAPIISNAACADNWVRLARINPVTDSVICAGFANNANGTCSGDSGGPLFANIDGVRTVVGAVSFGLFPCETNRATQGYARTSALSDFIQSASPNTQFITSSDFASATIVPQVMMLLDESEE